MHSIHPAIHQSAILNSATAALLSGFDSHFSSCGKEYHYKIKCGMPDPLLVRTQCWHNLICH